MSRSPLSSRTVRKSLGSFYKANVLWATFAVSTYGALYTGMLLALGMERIQIGWLMSLPLFMLPAQVLGAVLQQKYFNRKKFWAISLGFYLVMFALLALLVVIWPSLPKGLAVMLFAGAVVLGNFGFNLHRPVLLAWQTDIIPERENSVFWNKLTAQGMVAGVVAGFALGWVADRMGRDNRLTYALLLGVGLIFAVWSLRINISVPDPDPDPHPDTEEKVVDKVKALLKDSNFRHISGVFSLQSIAGWLSVAFIFVHLKETMGFTMVQMQALGAISCAVSFVAGRIFGIVGKHYGRKPVLLICTLVKCVEFLLWGTMRPGNHWFDNAVGSVVTSVLGGWAVLPPGFAGAIPVFVLGGFVNVGLASMQLAYMRNIGSPKVQTLAIGLFFALLGIVGGIASGLSGWLYSFVSVPGLGIGGTVGRQVLSLQQAAVGFGLVPFNVLPLLGALVFLLSAVLLARLREEGAAPTMHVVRVLLANNPLRGVYHAQMLANPLTEATRMNLLSRARGGLVEGELVRDFYSCSSQIRDGAMINIMGVGQELEPAAAEELVKLLSMPQLGIRVEAARALGRSRYKPALPSLVALFDNEDPDLAAASIYAAGLIGDQSVSPDLRRLLNEEDVPEAKAWAAEALSRVGAHSDARTVYLAFPENTDPVLRAQCLVSICRCMYDGQKVYRIFDDEMRNPGTATTLLCTSIAQRWHGLDADRLSGLVDGGNFRDVATLVLTPLLEFCLPCKRPEDVSEREFIKSQFTETGGFANDMLEDADYVATSLWLQLRLWAFLEYRMEYDDRLVLLTVLFLCDTLGKRLDPRQPRTRPSRP